MQGSQIWSGEWIKFFTRLSFFCLTKKWFSLKIPIKHIGKSTFKEEV
ncbi:hypothetical protein BREVNS_1134 [Brevinematales bacterium NS]|nr:hypothetical protein BREVNS_1134 [Brevinematales bacterium NS]